MPDDDFSSFRRSHADLDTAGERRIRDRFDELRTADDEGRGVVLSADHSVGEVERRRNRRTSRVIVGVAAALALVALIVTISVAGRDSKDSLAELASRAAARPDRELPTDAVLYQQLRRGERVELPGFAAAMFVYDVERWARRDGTGVERIDDSVIAEGSGDVPSYTPGVEQSALTEPRPLMDVMPYDELRALPADADALLDEAYRVTSDRRPADAAAILAGVLALDVTPPEVRAAVFEALAAMGARLLGRVTDDHGRVGNAFGDDTVDPSWMVVVDPASTDVLAFGRGTGPPEAPITGADRWVEYLDQRIESDVPS